MNASSDSALAAVQIIFMAGLLFWWVYLAGIALGIVVLVRPNRPLRRLAAFTIGLQFTPVVALLILFAMAFIGLALNNDVPAVFANGLAVVALFAGPGATISLIFAMAIRRGSNAGAGSQHPKARDGSGDNGPTP